MPDKKPNGSTQECPDCDGSGKVYDGNDEWVDCDRCNGFGKVAERPLGDAPLVEPEAVCGIAGCEGKHHPQDHNAAVERQPCPHGVAWMEDCHECNLAAHGVEPEANVWPLDPRVLTSAPAVEPEQPTVTPPPNARLGPSKLDRLLHEPVAPKAQRDYAPTPDAFEYDIRKDERARCVAIIEAETEPWHDRHPGWNAIAKIRAKIKGAQTNA